VRVGLKVAIVASQRTQRDIARAINGNENRLSEIVRGVVDPTQSERAALARELGRPEHDLFGDFATIDIRSVAR
jgi:transcriptional regulator with XRE-family HTH domain